MLTTMRGALATATAMLLAACPGPTNKTDSMSQNQSSDAPATANANAADKAKDLGPEAAAFTARCLEGLNRAREILPTIAAVSGPRTLANTVEPYNDLRLAVNLSAGMAELFSSVHPDEKIREAARNCEREVQAFGSALRLDRDLYDAFASLDTSGHDAESRRLVEHTLRDFRRAGVDRDEATRDRIKAIDDEITEYGQQFQKNIIEDVRHITVTSADQLAGLPQDFIDAHPPDENGDIKITTDYPDYLPFIRYADSNDLRRKLYIEFKSRGAGVNDKVLQKMLALRAEKARILGYDSWADYAIEDKMMKSASNAREFIARVVAIAEKRAKKDYAELLARKRKDVPGATRVEDYEKLYYQNLVKAENYAFDPQSVRPYFPYQQVEDGLLTITARIYDVEYKKVPDAEVWHPSVEVYDVTRRGDNLGRIYLDMHPREGKYKHAAQFPYRNGVAGKRLPEGVLVCNFPDPEKGTALMEHGDVVTMFHEFGHLMHHTFGGHKRWHDQSGVATEWDFVEAPSQMFEEWAWSHDTLKTFARHHETGAEIPAEMVERMRRADKFGLGVATLQQMYYAAISLNFHTADPATLDMSAMVKKLQGQYTPFPFVEGTSFHTSFGHLDGYSAYYYTYMWSLVIAKDLLTPFKKHGLMNTEWTHRYRDRILVPGGSKDAAALVHDFLGRDYNFDAFEDYLGG